MPKRQLTLSEFNAIRSYFSGADFERNMHISISTIFASGILWFIQRGFTKMKWRI